MSPGQQQWKDLYEFDTPVVHVERASTSSTSSEAQKLMHRFKEAEVLRLMEDAATSEGKKAE